MGLPTMCNHLKSVGRLSHDAVVNHHREGFAGGEGPEVEDQLAASAGSRRKTSSSRRPLNRTTARNGARDPGARRMKSSWRSPPVWIGWDPHFETALLIRRVSDR